MRGIISTKISEIVLNVLFYCAIIWYEINSRSASLRVLKSALNAVKTSVFFELRARLLEVERDVLFNALAPEA